MIFLNYGSLLQAYATTNIVFDFGYHAELIDYKYPNNYHKHETNLLIKALGPVCADRAFAAAKKDHELYFVMKILFSTNSCPTSTNSITDMFVVQQVPALIQLGCYITLIVSNTLCRASHFIFGQLGLLPGRNCLHVLPVARLLENSRALLMVKFQNI